jgi:ABC-2 type transport system ATP-binding protein
LLLQVNQVSKQYANHLALDRVSLDVPEGSILGLLGPNGAGKTSLIRIITQITAPDSGTVHFAGEPLQRHHTHQIGYLPEERGLYKKMKVGDTLHFFAKLKGLSNQQSKTMIDYWVNLFEMQTWWNKQVEELSKGMQQKVQFIATVLHKPRLLILDEPFSGFDPINSAAITAAILKLKQEGCTIIFSTHRMESVEQMCDYITLLNRSHNILSGEVQAIKKQFDTHTFEVKHNQPLQGSTIFQIQTTQQLGDGSFYSIIQKETQLTNNDLLSQLMLQTEVLHFERKLPSMNDIFVKAVSDATL